MKKNEISEVIGNISDKYVTEAILYTGEKNNIRHSRLSKWRALAACLCIVLVGAFAISKLNPSEYLTGYYPDIDKLPESTLPDSEAAGTEIPEQIPANQDETDTSPVYYSSLRLADSILNEEAFAVTGPSMMDITSFDESALLQDNCCMIIEGIVTDLYVKHYSYDIYSDKFEKNGILHGRTDTIVYEVAVDKTWYGSDVSGDPILIEDTSYFIEPVLAVKEGGRYVLPIYEHGDAIWTLGHEYAGGDITRETVYSTVYPFHPQIEVTRDGSYIVSEDWTTLTAKNAREIIMDTLDYDDFWKDKMYLVDGKTFEEHMAVLLSDLQAQP